MAAPPICATVANLRPDALPELGELLAHWGRHLRAHKAMHTVISYERTLRQAVAFFTARLGRPPGLSDFTRAAMQAFIEAASPGNMKAHMTGLRMFFHFLVDLEELPVRDASRGLICPRIDPRPPPPHLSDEQAVAIIEGPLLLFRAAVRLRRARTITDSVVGFEKVRRLLSMAWQTADPGRRLVLAEAALCAARQVRAARGLVTEDLPEPPPGVLSLRDHVVLLFLYGMGLRAEEVTRIDVFRILPDPPPYRLQVHGKGDRWATVPLGRRVQAGLLAYLERRRELVVDPGEPALLLQGPEGHGTAGGRLSRNAIYRTVRRYVPEEIQCYPHLFRHAFCSHLLDAGAPVAHVRDLMRHKSLATTSTYAHSSGRALAGALALHPLDRVGEEDEEGD